MKIKTLKLKNFRGYKDTVTVQFSELTTLVGKNDVGKSTILEALDIFFNDGKNIVKMEKEDVNIRAFEENNRETVISVVFEELPTTVVIDTAYRTTLADEYLLNADGYLEVVKRYNNGSSPKIYIKANHPTSANCRGLLSKKITELRSILDANEIPCDNRGICSCIRKAIWNHFSDTLCLSEEEIDVAKEDAKKIWDNLSSYLPLYFLFQADRKNSDKDDEVQDPLLAAVKEILQDQAVQEKLEEVARIVKGKLSEVSNHTREKLREMDSTIADSLNPVLPEAADLKWSDVFKKVSITGDNISINKRGSGVKRLILLNFFRAEAERKAREGGRSHIIYAIEEPETSQHTANQIIMIRALKQLSQLDNVQVVLTTHSATIVKELSFSDLRLILRDENGNRRIEIVQPGQLCYPSLNEVNYIAFEDITIEYFNELYGYLEAIGQLSAYKSSQPMRPYVRIKSDGSLVTEQKCTAEYVRHQIHHPENRHNAPYTIVELRRSIESMRTFIDNLP